MTDFATMGSNTDQSIDFMFCQSTADKKAVVRVGKLYQAEIPQCVGLSCEEQDTSETDKDTLLWSPSSEANITDNQVDSYLENARTAALKTSSNNLEHALHVLHQAKGDINEATLMLASSSAPQLPAGHPMSDYTYTACEVWSKEELKRLYESLCRHNKVFDRVSKDMHTKSIKQCVQYYYVWKKQYPHIYRSAYLGKARLEAQPILGNPHKTRSRTKTAAVGAEQKVTKLAAGKEEIRDKIRRVHLGKPSYQVQPLVGTPHKTRGIRKKAVVAEKQVTKRAALAAEQKVTKLAAETDKTQNTDATLLIHENIDQPLQDIWVLPPSTHRGEEQVACVKTSGKNVINERDATPQQNSFECSSSKQSPRSYLKKHQKKSKPRPCTQTENKLRDNTSATTAMNEQSRETVFPCAQCDRVFLKIKSRNAHMKCHKRA